MSTRMNSRPRPDSDNSPPRRVTRGTNRPVSSTSKTRAGPSASTRIPTGSRPAAPRRGRAVVDRVRRGLARGELHVVAGGAVQAEVGRGSLGEVAGLLEAPE